MMKLPADWETTMTCSPVKRLFELAHPSDEPELARNLVWSYFDLLQRTYWERRGLNVAIIESPRLFWQVNDVTVRYVTRVDDELLEWWKKKPAIAEQVLIVPVNQSRVARAALASVTTVPPDVYSINSLIDYRIGMTALDTGWTLSETRRELFASYNKRALENRSPVGLIVDLSGLPS